MGTTSVRDRRRRLRIYAWRPCGGGCGACPDRISTDILPRRLLVRRHPPAAVATLASPEYPPTPGAALLRCTRTRYPMAFTCQISRIAWYVIRTPGGAGGGFSDEPPYPDSAVIASQAAPGSTWLSRWRRFVCPSCRAPRGACRRRRCRHSDRRRASRPSRAGGRGGRGRS